MLKKERIKSVFVLYISAPDFSVSGVQIPVQKLKKLNKIKLQLKQTILSDGDEVRGGCILPNGYLVFTDYSETRQCLAVYKKDGTFLYDIPLSPVSAFGIVSFVKSTVVVSGGHTKTISVIDVNNKKILASIQTDCGCYGITKHKGQTLFCGENTGLLKYDVDRKTISLFISDKTVSTYSNIISNGDKICYTNPHVVTLLDSQGKKLFQVRDDNLIQSPRGIAMDEFMNIYLVGLDSHNLVVISPDGKDKLELLCRKDCGLKFPAAVYYDSGQLLICQGFGWAFLYVVK